MNERITIIREPEREIQTKGQLLLSGDPFSCKTLELPWKENKNGISCIPDGLYFWEKVPQTDNIPYEHIWIKNVPSRKGIKIHIANFAAGKKIELKGCIAVGDRFFDLNYDGNDDIVNSGKTFKALMAILPAKGTIEIKTRKQIP